MRLKATVHMESDSSPSALFTKVSLTGSRSVLEMIRIFFSFKMFSFFFFFPLFIKWIYATLQTVRLQVKCLGSNNLNLIKRKFVKKWLLQETNAIVFQKDIYIFVSQVCTSKNNLKFKTKFFLWLGKIWFEWVIQQRTASNLTYQVCCYLQIFLSTLPIMEPTRLTSD